MVRKKLRLRSELTGSKRSSMSTSGRSAREARMEGKEVKHLRARVHAVTTLWKEEADCEPRKQSFYLHFYYVILVSQPPWEE